MRGEPTDHRTLLARRDQLFSPDPRLGWVFRDRWWFLRPFNRPVPQRQRLPEHLSQRINQTEELAARRLRRTLPLSLAAAAALLLLSACSASDYALSRTPIPVGSLLLAVIVATPGTVLTWFAVHQRHAARQSYQLAQQQQANDFEARAAQWRAHKQAHEVAEFERLNALPEWGAVPRPGRRLDVFGGTLWSWEALLTTYGTSALSTGPLLVLDLSREVVCRELITLAPAAGVAVDAQLLPSRLADSSLLTGLTPPELVDAIVESMYGGGEEATRAERSMDSRILSAVCAALGDQITLGRIAAALRALMGEPDNSQALTRDERQHIGTQLFTVEYRRQAHPNLSRIESYIHPLEDLGSRAEHQHGYLTCIALDSQARNVGSELLTDLIVQWVTHRITATVDHRPAVLVAGADELTRRHLERLSDACERREVPLTLLFRRLRETSLEMLGGGAVAFMRLGNHQDATAAADFIGRDYRFVLSQITKNLGGNESHTRTDTTGEGDSESVSSSHTTGTSTSWGTTRSSGVTYSGGLGPFPDRSTNRQTSRSRGGGTSQSDTTGTSTSTSRNWSAAYAYAEGTNWSDADTTQRVYEYLVEPHTLQHLPDHALLLVDTAPGGGRTLTPVECDPAIITLDRATTQSLPDPPPPRAAIQAPSPPLAAYEPQRTPSSYQRQAPYLPQWATPPTPSPPRPPLPQQPGPPAGQHTGPRPDFAEPASNDEDEDWQPGQIWPRMPRPDSDQAAPDPPPPGWRSRRPSGPNPPRQGPPPLFGRDKD